MVASKSETNRVLLLNALGGGVSTIHNISSARDSHTMQHLLKSSEQVLDVLDAGTVMRFMTAYLAICKEGKVITGTPRMCQRPIGPLVDALRTIGANIEYVQQHGYPPLRFYAFEEQKANEIAIPGNISSQYISALLMIAPSLPNGLRLNIEGQIYSMPYIQMTLNLMQQFGIESEFVGQTITIRPQPYATSSYTVESDWSGASYWYAMVALCEGSSLSLKGLRANSNQGDSAIVEIMNTLGVKTEFTDEGVTIQHQPASEHLQYDFKSCPDLAQTVISVAAVQGITLEMTGLESLKIKETDRITAMAREVSKVGATLSEDTDSLWRLTVNKDFTPKEPIVFDTYDDHRMAMALAPICLKHNITIKEPEVVRKSYPEFWDHMNLVGVKMITEA